MAHFCPVGNFRRRSLQRSVSETARRRGVAERRGGEPDREEHRAGGEWGVNPHSHWLVNPAMQERGICLPASPSVSEHLYSALHSSRKTDQ